MTTVYLIRHAEAEGNISRTYHGITNSEITQNGEKQLKLLSKRMKDIPIDVIYSSPLKRAYKTSKAVRGDRNIDIVIDPQIQEICGGEWEMMPWQDVLKNFPREAETWTEQLHLAHPPGGESMTQVYNRMVSAVLRFVKENKDKTIAVTSHGAALIAFHCYLREVPLKCIRDFGLYDNTAVTKVEFDDDLTPHVVFELDNSHLGELSSLHKQKWEEYNNK